MGRVMVPNCLMIFYIGTIKGFELAFDFFIPNFPTYVVLNQCVLFIFKFLFLFSYSFQTV